MSKLWSCFQMDCILNATVAISRHGLAIGSTGTFPGGLAADLARCPVFYFILFFKLFYLFIFCLPIPNVPKWLFPSVAFPNKSIINHKSLSLDWQHRASCLFLASVKRFWTESMRGTRGRRGNIQKKQLNVAKLLTCSGLQVQVSFICNMLQ